MRVWQSRPVLARLHRAMELIRRRTLPQGLLGHLGLAHTTQLSIGTPQDAYDFF